MVIVWNATYLIDHTRDLIPNPKLTCLQMPNVQHVTIVHPHVDDCEICGAFDRDDSHVVLLTSGFSVKVRLVEQEAESGAMFQE